MKRDKVRGERMKNAPFSTIYLIELRSEERKARFISTVRPVVLLAVSGCAPIPTSSKNPSTIAASKLLLDRRISRPLFAIISEILLLEEKDAM